MIGPALLFCPGSRPDRFARAAAAADSVILDLEDAVAPTDKPAARAAVATALADGAVAPDRCVVRINPLDGEWGPADVAALRDTPVTTVLLPKAADPATVARLAPWHVLALCETARGVLAARELSEVDNCVGLMWGAEDLTADLGGRASRRSDGSYLPHVVHARVTVLLAACAAGRIAVDGVYLDIADTDGLAAETTEAVAMGFGAKACIHPDQAPVIRAAYRPSTADVEWAREVIAAVAASTGVTTVRGNMVDEPILRHAHAILAADLAADA
ncbi:CoA ester lyase [Amycolatopsis sp. K13G38]|uniref:CoA ester lyase n=1 Tax=Amycolatopsis acididurans TaxID=2724524 RepID=A0ABX1JLV1_9PSEU|nr:CoA ester lyase [Amycolatopsis acididurans]NKQ59242.1 CoA ester lyase [Amycolatopsis acididurans]